jgi:hypothetical protein
VNVTASASASAIATGRRVGPVRAGSVAGTVWRGVSGNGPLRIFSSIDLVPGIGRVFIGLVGSEHNLLDLPGDGTIGARSASDAEGLYSMIQYTKEQPDGPDISADRLERDLPSYYMKATDEQRIQAVASTFNGYAIQSAPRPTEVLFEVHHVARNIDLEALRLRTDGGGHVDLALFGAPLWIREATDREYLSIADVLAGPGGIEARWESFDEELRRHVRDAHHATVWTPDTDDDWRHFGRWAAAWSQRVAAGPTPLMWTPKRYRLLGLEWGEPRDVPVRFGVDGWLASDWDQDQYLVSLSGDIYPVWTQDDAAIYNQPTHPQRLAWDSDDVQPAARAIFLSSTRQLLPFAR